MLLVNVTAYIRVTFSSNNWNETTAYIIFGKKVPLPIKNPLRAEIYGHKYGRDQVPHKYDFIQNLFIRILGAFSLLY